MQSPPPCPSRHTGEVAGTSGSWRCSGQVADSAAGRKVEDLELVQTAHELAIQMATYVSCQRFRPAEALLYGEQLQHIAAVTVCFCNAATIPAAMHPSAAELSVCVLVHALSS